MPVTIDGLNSGLDTETIVKGLQEIQQAQIDRLKLRKQTVLNKKAAYQSLEAQLVSFKSAASRLANVQNNVFESRTVNVSDESALIATANSKAATGVYQLSVEALAQAHQVGSQGFADLDSEISVGTLTIRQGSRPAVEITVDQNNNTLQGLADSINLSGAGIQATIINDGSNSGTSYRLLLTSEKTGVDNAISLTNNLAPASGGAIQPTFDFGSPIQAAQNAQVKLGSGAGGLLVESATNRVSGLINGVELDLLQANAGRPITVRVQPDTETATGAVQEFVDAYNSIVSFIETQTRFIPDSGEAGILIGDRSLLQIESDLQNVLQTVVPGLDPKANRISSIGISFTDNGKITLNSNQLQKVLNGEVAGVKPSDLRKLFALDGTSSNANIQFVLGSNRTKATNDIQVDVTQAAERAAIQGSLPIASSTVIDNTNQELTLTVDGTQITVNLTAGTYTQSGLAEEFESVINAHPSLVGRAVSVGLDVGDDTHLTVTSDAYGSSSQVTIQSGTALNALGFSGTENDQGVNVAGVFIINGVEEEAVGRGRLLSGLAKNEHTADLQVRVALTPSQVLAGPEGEIDVVRGVASKIDQIISGFIDTQTGELKSINERYTADSESIQDSIDRQIIAFDQQQQDLIAQFVALERAIGELKSTGEFLTQQFASLSNINKK